MLWPWFHVFVMFVSGFTCLFVSVAFNIWFCLVCQSKIIKILVLVKHFSANGKYIFDYSSLFYKLAVSCVLISTLALI